MYLGSEIRYIGETKRPTSQIPLILHQGELICETPQGKLSHLLLTTHQVSTSSMKKNQKISLEYNLMKHLELLRYLFFRYAGNNCDSNNLLDRYGSQIFGSMELVQRY